MHHCVSSVLHIYHLRLSVKPKALPVRCPCGLYSGVPAKTSYEKPGEISPRMPTTAPARVLPVPIRAEGPYTAPASIPAYAELCSAGI